MTVTVGAVRSGKTSTGIRIASMLPQEARKRGFPTPDEADVLFDYIEKIDAAGRTFTSAGGRKFNILSITEV